MDVLLKAQNTMSLFLPRSWSNTRMIYQEVIPTAKQFVEQLPRLIYALDEPLAGPGLFPQYAVSKLAREHVTVVLGGQG